MSFAFGFRSDGDDGGSGAVSGGESGRWQGEGKNGRKYWENLGILEGRSLGRNTLEDVAMGHGTAVTSVSPPGASLPKKVRLSSQMQSWWYHTVLPRFWRIRYSPNLESHMRSHGLCQHTSSRHSALPLTSTWVTLLGLDFFICMMGIMGSRICECPPTASILVSSGGSPSSLGFPQTGERLQRGPVLGKWRCLVFFTKGNLNSF